MVPGPFGTALPPAAFLLLLVAAVGIRGESPAGPDPQLLALAGGGPPVLLLAFQQGDCGTYARGLASWNEVARSGEARVTAVGIRFPDEPLVRTEVVGALALEYPVRFDLARTGERLLLRLGYRRTPVAMLLDRSGRVRLSFPLPRDAGRARRAVALVLDHARRISREGAAERSDGR